MSKEFDEDVKDLFKDVKELVEMIMGCDDAKNIDSLALKIGHHELILNPPT